MFRPTRYLSFIIALAAIVVLSITAKADNFTLQGAFSRDDGVQLFDLTVTTVGTIDLRSYAYAGGATSTGTTITRGGFDTILTLFDGAGTFIDDNDDGAGVAIDPMTDAASDARLILSLAPGSYILALTQFDNFANGLTLSDGFEEAGQGNFTADPSFTLAGPCPGGRFRDSTGTAGRCRTGEWAIDFINVAQVTARPGTPVPEPATLLLLGSGLAAVGGSVRRRRDRAKMS